jgi:RsmE family RNA methyltransferase
MNLILLQPEDFVATAGAPDAPRLVRLTGRRLDHVRDVHRARVGQSLTVGLAGDRVGRGRVVRLDDAALELEVELTHPPPPKLPLTLVLALPRPKVLGRTVAAAASLGVARIVLVNAWRVEKSYWGNARVAPGALRRDLELGLEQARDTVLPELLIRRLFVPFAEDELPALIAGGAALVAYPGAAAPAPRGPLSGPVTLAVGPEGGFIAAEIASLERAGFVPISLGERVLRVETAVAALVGRLF